MMLKAALRSLVVILVLSLLLVVPLNLEAADVEGDPAETHDTIETRVAGVEDLLTGFGPTGNINDYQSPYFRICDPNLDSAYAIHFGYASYEQNDTGADVSIWHVKKEYNGDIKRTMVDSFPSTDSGYLSLMMDVILGADDTPYLVYSNLDVHPDLRGYKCAAKTDDGWIVSDLPSTLTVTGGYAGMVADDRGRFHIIFLNDVDGTTNTAAVRYMNNIGGDWNSYTLGRALMSEANSFANIDITTRGDIVVHYKNAERDLIEASLLNGVWRFSNLLDVPSDFGDFPRRICSYARTDLAGHRHIYYFDQESPNSGGKYQYMSDASGQWVNLSVPSEIDSVEDIGWTIQKNAIMKVDTYYTDYGNSYRNYNFVKIFRQEGSKWAVRELSNHAYYSNTGGTVRIGINGSIDVIDYDKRITFTDTWPSLEGDVSLNAVAGDRNVSLSWTSSGIPEASGYRIYRKDPFIDSYTVLADTNESHFVDAIVDDGTWNPMTRLINGMEYLYRVTVLSPSGESSPSNEATVVPCTKPGAPEDLFAFYDGNSVALVWNGPSDDGGADVTGYDVVCRDWEDREIWNRTLGNVTLLDSDMYAPGERYVFRVTTKNAAGTGGSSSFEFVTPDPNEASYYVLSKTSTTSNIVYDNDSKKITFVVEGNEGTLGLSFVVIPKDLVDNSSDLRATLDGSELPITVQETDTSYVITMSYHHSTHEVAVYWGEDSGTSAYIVPIALGLIAAAVVVGILWYVRRKDRP